MLKAEGRKLYKEKRQSISFAEKAKWNDLLLIQFQTVELPFIHSLLSYWPIEEKNEPDTHLFTDYIEFRNPALKVFYPQTDSNGSNFHAVEVNLDTAFQLNQYNIHEPVDGNIVSPNAIDMVFVPMLLADQQGHRIGYGKGFYDKYLSDCREDCLKIGFCYFEPIEKIDDLHEFDIPLDICITPSSVYVF